MNHTTIAVDISKEVFEIAVSKTPGKVAERCRLRRRDFVPFFVQRQPATVVMEACGSAHHWGREITQLGHTVRLLPTLHTKPYVRRNKTNRTDVRGLLEANRNEDIHPVPIKTIGLTCPGRPSSYAFRLDGHSNCSNQYRAGHSEGARYLRPRRC